MKQLPSCFARCRSLSAPTRFSRLGVKEAVQIWSLINSDDPLWEDKISTVIRRKADPESLEAEKREAHMQEAKRLEAEKQEAEKREAERQEAERLEAKRQEAERLEAEKREAEKREAERQEAERLEAKRQEAERLEAEKREAEKREAERQEAERVEAKRQEAERLEAEKREAEKREAERQEAERREAERQEAERQEAKRQEAERKEVEKREAEKREAERKEAERQEAKRLEAEKQEVQRREAERAAMERQAPATLSQTTDNLTLIPDFTWKTYRDVHALENAQEFGATGAWDCGQLVGNEGFDAGLYVLKMQLLTAMPPWSCMGMVPENCEGRHVPGYGYLVETRGDTLCIRVDVTSRRVYAAKNDADYELVALNLPTTGRLFPAVCLETGSSGAVRFNVSVYSAEPQTPK